jgi:hypothetical protein
VRTTLAILSLIPLVAVGQLTMLVSTNTHRVLYPTNFWSASVLDMQLSLQLGSAATNPASAFEPAGAVRASGIGVTNIGGTVAHNIQAGSNITLSTNGNALVITGAAGGGGGGGGTNILVNGSIVNGANLTNSATLTFGVSGTNIIGTVTGMQATNAALTALSANPALYQATNSALTALASNPALYQATNSALTALAGNPSLYQATNANLTALAANGALYQSTNTALTTLVAGGTSTNFFAGDKSYKAVQTNWVTGLVGDVANLQTLIAAKQTGSSTLTNVSTLSGGNSTNFFAGDGAFKAVTTNVITGLTGDIANLNAADSIRQRGSSTLTNLSAGDGSGLTNVVNSSGIGVTNISGKVSHAIQAGANITLTTNGAALVITGAAGGGGGGGNGTNVFVNGAIVQGANLADSATLTFSVANATNINATVVGMQSTNANLTALSANANLYQGTNTHLSELQIGDGNSMTNAGAALQSLTVLGGTATNASSMAVGPSSSTATFTNSVAMMGGVATAHNLFTLGTVNTAILGGISYLGGNTTIFKGTQAAILGGTVSSGVRGGAWIGSATGNDSFAFGFQASTSTFTNAWAIGRDSTNTTHNQIMLGSLYDAVVIPTTLTVSTNLLSAAGAFGAITVTNATTTGSLVNAGTSTLAGAVTAASAVITNTLTVGTAFTAKSTIAGLASGLQSLNVTNAAVVNGQLTVVSNILGATFPITVSSAVTNWVVDFSWPVNTLQLTTNVFFIQSTNRPASATNLVQTLVRLRGGGVNQTLGFNATWSGIGTPLTTVTNSKVVLIRFTAWGSNETNVTYEAVSGY